MNLQEINSLSDKEKQEYLAGRSLSNRGVKPGIGKVCGVGVNDATYNTQPSVEGKQVWCPAYRCWRNMINRCYNEGYQRDNPTYVGTSVCTEWLKFSNFLSWWKDNQVNGYDLDKDLLSDDNTYSPNTCVFVPKWLNRFTLSSKAIRGSSPIGTTYHKATGRYQASCKNPIIGGVEYLGIFECQEDAYASWRDRKLELAEQLRVEMDKVDYRIYDRIVKLIKGSK